MRLVTNINKLILLIAILVGPLTFAQKKGDVYVDQEGVMRWGNTPGRIPNAEVQGFGTNYTVPFAYAYRTAKKMGISLEKTIDNDVYHFARLGFDSYRVHVWDTEISDTLGNLLENEHLKLFDYLLKQMKDRGIKFILTPIAYWGNGWPEPDEKTPGFLAKYGKAACLTNPDAIKAQENYLFQFLNHVNPYTGVAYRNEPDLIAFEISNEPHHEGMATEVTAFINRMVASMRRTGCQKPIFYNISHSIHLADGYLNADIQGGTFQWYPTGLESHHELRGNLLPNVDRYTIPFADNPRFKKMAKLVYEFDAADVGRSYIYPAMARSFRAAGMQMAHQFAYDPTFMAATNTEYATHFMNLAYAPQKALSLKVASAVFHRLPMNQPAGRFPADTIFENFRVSYQRDLAELVTETQFIYTNTTNAILPAADKLTEIAGFGKSVVVKYGGTGAYFLDRIEPGVWRLELMPDAIWVKDVFGFNSLKKENAVINWRSWPMSINLPDLGVAYTIQPLNEGNLFTGQVNGNSFNSSPGTYLLVRKGVKTQLTGTSHWKNITLKEYTAPATTLTKTYLLHQPMTEVTANQPLKLEASVVSRSEPDAVDAYVLDIGSRWEKIRLTPAVGYTYTGRIPGSLIREGFLHYYLVVTEKGTQRIYPSEQEENSVNWDFRAKNAWQIRVVPKNRPVILFNAATDSDQLSRAYLPGSQLMPVEEPGEAELLIPIEKLATTDPENKNAPPVYDYSMRYNFSAKLAGRRQTLPSFQNITLKGRSLNDKPCPVQLALITRNGLAYGGTVTVDMKTGSYVLPVNQLKPVKLVSLPAPYPSFLPYFTGTNSSAVPLDLSTIESLQVSIGPGLFTEYSAVKHGLGIIRVTME